MGATLMSTSEPGKRKPLGTWAVVLGTIMVAIACFDAAWGLATVALGEHLQIIAGELDGNRLGIAVGRVVHFVTFGVLTVSGVETAEHAGALLAMLPRPDYLVIVGWIRFGISVAACISGVLLTWRWRCAAWASLIWAVGSVCWTAWVTIQTWGVMTDGVGDPWHGDSLPYFILEVTVHFGWPLVLGVWLAIALARRPHEA